MTTWPVQLLFAAWNDLDHALGTVTDEQMIEQVAGGSSFAWTLAHVTYEVDAWINVRFQGYEKHPLISQPRFKVGGSGVATDCTAIREATDHVRAVARGYLERLDGADLERVVPYDGSYAPFRAYGMQLRATVLQIARHHTYHLGEIVTKLDLLGLPHGEYPLPIMHDPSSRI